MLFFRLLFLRLFFFWLFSVRLFFLHLFFLRLFFLRLFFLRLFFLPKETTTIPQTDNRFPRRSQQTFSIVLQSRVMPTTCFRGPADLKEVIPAYVIYQRT